MSDTMEIQVKDLRVGDVITHWENWDRSMVKSVYGPWTVTEITPQGRVECTSTEIWFEPVIGSDKGDLRVRIVARASKYANQASAERFQALVASLV